MSKNLKDGPFSNLSVEERKKVPVIYPSLEKGPTSSPTYVKSKYHRSDCYNTQIFHRPISQPIRYDK